MSESGDKKVKEGQADHVLILQIIAPQHSGRCQSLRSEGVKTAQSVRLSCPSKTKSGGWIRTGLERGEQVLHKVMEGSPE